MTMVRTPMRAVQIPQMTTSLWSPSDVLAAIVPTVIGVVAWVIAWYEASGADTYAKQVGWTDLAVVGLIVATVSEFLWILKGRRTVGEARLALVRLTPTKAPVDRSSAQFNLITAEPARQVVFGRAYVFFHRPECPMATDRSWSPAARADAADAGLTPCEICRPLTSLMGWPYRHG